MTQIKLLFFRLQLTSKSTQKKCRISTSKATLRGSRVNCAVTKYFIIPISTKKTWVSPLLALLPISRSLTCRLPFLTLCSKWKCSIFRNLRLRTHRICLWSATVPLAKSFTSNSGTAKRPSKASFMVIQNNR